MEKHKDTKKAAPSGPGPADRNIRLIAELERAALHERSAGERLSDAIARMTGSMPFAVGHIACFVLWMLANTGQVPGVEPFDPFPFSFLTLVVSLEAIFLSVFVLMSQNRLMKQADNRAHLDLQVNLLAEQELTAMLQMLRALCAKLEVAVDIPETSMDQLSDKTDIHQLASALKDRLPQE